MTRGDLSIPASIVLTVVVPVGLVIALILFALKRKGRAEAPPPSPAMSVSIFAGLSFFAGLGSILMVTAAGILAMALSMTGMIHIEAGARPGLDICTRIILYGSLLPAVASVALALAARGSISENRDRLRGRPLYRTGILLAVLTTVVVLDSTIISPSTWASAGENLIGRAPTVRVTVDHAYFGATASSSPDTTGGLLTKIEPGSPAEKAGLRVGDRILAINGNALAAGDQLQERMAAFSPGARVQLEVRRGEESLSLSVELGSSLAQFEPLLTLVEAQSLDDERLTVLKAVGLHRSYKVEELSRICRAFDFDDGRLKVIEPALPHLQDPQNAYQLLGTLDFAHAKNKLSGWIEDLRKKK